MASKFLPKYPVPEDFPDILHKFAREVLRDQPENIYEYGAQYFRAIYEVSIERYSLLENRNGERSPRHVIAKKIERIYLGSY